ncbi:hypothetical protein FQN52_005252 [Onygenales sp. PD_12]|nr:hypothetical protein FQN52_005252 [Onygenales sp. PD_12]
MLKALSLFLPFFLPIATSISIPPRQWQQSNGKACNNSPLLCSLSYGEITHLGAHNSPFLRDASTGFSSSGNQFYNTTIQLDSGVRLVSGQIHENDGEWHLCHTSCSLLDAGRVRDWLSEIKRWMDRNPNDVVTVLLVNADNAPPADLDAEFKAADLTSSTYKPPSTSMTQSSWPTLQALIEAKTRLMVFTTSLPSTSTPPPYLMNEFEYIFETAFEIVNPSNFSCNPHRPSQVHNNINAALTSGRLPFLNHFLGNEGGLGIVSPNIDKINITNGPATAGGTQSLGSFAQKCQREYWGRKPTFILVDYFDQGPAIETVDALNGVSEPVGRKPVPDSNSEALKVGGRPMREKGYMFRGLADLLEMVKSGSQPSLGNWIWVGGEWGALIGGGVAVG